MKTLPKFLISALITSYFALLAHSASAAGQSVSFPTHCKAGEFAYLNASMAKIHSFPKPNDGWKQGDTLYELRKIGKILSICADSSSEPLHSVAYRFGPIGKVEMEQVSTASNRFHIFEQSTSPHTGEHVFFFTVGLYTYCVTEATGQGSGIGLIVLKDGRKVLDLFSGTGLGKDFEYGVIDIQFSSNRSPALQLFNSADPSPCDARPTP